MGQIVAEREAAGAFKSLFDFAGRVDPTALNKRMLENVAKAGAFDGLEKNRARVIAGLETLIRFAQGKAADRASNQVSLFGGGGKDARSEEHESELQSLMRISYAVFCLKKKQTYHEQHVNSHHLI